MFSKLIFNDLQNRNFCRIRGTLKLTKTNENFSDILVTRDVELELQTLQWLNGRVTSQDVFSRYQAYEPRLKNKSWPQHYAARILSGAGSACSGENIFMFFPHVFSEQPQSENDVFGLEFVDIWANIFRSVIFPIAHRIFDQRTLVNLISLKNNLEKTIYLAAAFHEIGHRCGPFQVSPKPLEHICLQTKLLDIMGEISTDALLVSKLSEFAEITQFVVLQRLFWFGRKGFLHDPVAANVNVDNDAWLGSFIWQKLISNKCLSLKENKYELDFETCRNVFEEITSEIDLLVRNAQSPDEQNENVKEWMRSNVTYLNENFVLPQTFKTLLGEIQDIPEIPQFRSPYSYSFIDALTGSLENEKSV